MKFYTRRRVSPVITIVSLVDILTMVLMFFVYTTTFKTAQEQVKIVLPEVKNPGEAVSETTPIILAVAPDGGIFLDNKSITLEDLGEAVKKLDSKTRSLQMKADTKANFGQVMKVLDILNGVGVHNVSTQTQKAQ